jgi:peptidoglycan/LPS O-acetylase OafA/YrhL
MATRVGGLDAVRALAALMVFATHAVGMFPDSGSLLGPWDGAREGALAFGPWGGNGVYVFFALSGYLLWRPFVDGRPNLVAYTLLRAARILPAYWLACLVLVPLFGGDLLRFLVLGPRSAESEPLGVLWTLQAEVQFYLAVPLLAMLGRPLAVPLVLGAGSLALELALANTAHHGSMAESMLPVRFWAFVPGMILAARPPQANRMWLASALILLAIAAWWNPYTPGGGQHTNVLSAVGAFALVGWGISATPAAPRLWSALAAISYGLYLWHADLIRAYGAVGIGLTFVIATASYGLMERPILSVFRKRIASSPSARRARDLAGGEPPLVGDGLVVDRLDRADHQLGAETIFHKVPARLAKRVGIWMVGQQPNNGVRQRIRIP